MSADTIVKVFNVSIVLVGEDGTVATPDSDGDFCLYEMNTNVSWTVNGDPSKPTATENFLSAKTVKYCNVHIIHSTGIHAGTRARAVHYIQF